MIRVGLNSLLAVGLAVAVSSPVAAASVSRRLTPTGPWTVDYEDQSCVLKRPMSGEKEAYQLSIESPPFQSKITVTIKHKTKVFVPAFGKLAVYVDGTQIVTKARFAFYYSSNDESVHMFNMNYQESRLDGLKSILRLSGSADNDFELEIPNFQKAIGVFADCKNDLHRSLGVEPSDVATIAVSPQGSVIDVVRPPVPGGSMNFRILYWVRADGKVDRCSLIKPSGYTSFDKHVCVELERKARFTPAKDAAGRNIDAPRYEYIRVGTAEAKYEYILSQ